jgi:organic radical activating enzyme
MKKYKIIKEKTTEKYKISLIQEENTEYAIVIKSVFGGSYSAKHTKYQVLDSDGSILESRKIDLNISDLIIQNIVLNGETEGFNIFDPSISKNKIFIKNNLIDSKDVKHKLSNSEKSFTSRGEKLNYHWPIFKKYSETGYGSIIRATLTLHQLCSSHCHYCSTIARNRKDSISLNEAKKFVRELYFDQADFNKENFPTYNDLYNKACSSDIRLKGLILSGGGQPNLWPHFAEFVEWLSELDIELGLITNGFPKKVDDSVYEHFTWIRLSITPEDASPHYLNGKFNNQYIPEIIKNNKKITFGLSYVHGAWTTNDILHRIKSTINLWGMSYCRMLTDCNLTRSSQLQAHKSLANKLFELGYIDIEGNPKGKIFHQLKYHGTEEEGSKLWNDGQCYLQIYNVFWDTTGHEEYGESYCYTCDSITVLSDELDDGGISSSERKFNSDKWGTVTNKNIKSLFLEKARPYFDPRNLCSSCLFMNNNNTVKDLVHLKDFSSISIDRNIQHVNFP